VTINDRSPKTKQHLIDLTPAAAAQIGWRERLGESHVRVEVLDPQACEAGSPRERGCAIAPQLTMTPPDG
jgi:rare lipoprotein A (peptidoglycan hydrolase)